MHSYQSHRFHIIFSTKDRAPFLVESIEREIWGYLASTAREKGAFVYEVGGYDDHIHVLVSIPADTSVSDIVQAVKGTSSRWLKQCFQNSAMGWQTGYSSFTCSVSHTQKTIQYIKQQRIHHQSKSFDEEMKALIALHQNYFQ